MLRNAVTRILALTLPPRRRRSSRRDTGRPPVEHSGEGPDSALSGSTTAALRAGRRLPVPRDLLPVLRRRLWAIAIAAPRRQERVIAGPHRLETNLALPPKEVGTARLERGAGLPRVGPRRSDFSGPDFRFLTARARAALAEKPLPPVGGCAIRALGRLAPRHWCRGPIRAQEDSPSSRHAPQVHSHLARRAARFRRAADCAVRARRVRLPPAHAALHRTGSGRLVTGFRAGLPVSCADRVRAALRLGLHCAAHPAQCPICLAPYRVRLVLRADLRADCVDRVGPDCRVTRPGRGPGPTGQRPARRGDLRVHAAARAAWEPHPAWMERAGSATGQWGVPCQTLPAHSNLPVGFVL